MNEIPITIDYQPPKYVVKKPGMQDLGNKNQEDLLIFLCMSMRPADLSLPVKFSLDITPSAREQMDHRYNLNLVSAFEYIESIYQLVNKYYNAVESSRSSLDRTMRTLDDALK